MELEKSRKGGINKAFEIWGGGVNGVRTWGTRAVILVVNCWNRVKQLTVPIGECGCSLF